MSKCIPKWVLDHGVHIVGEREVVDVKCNDAQIVLIVNKDKASDRFKHKHAHVLSDMFQCVHQGGQSDPAYDLDPAPTHGTHIGVAVRRHTYNHMCYIRYQSHI